MTESPKTFGFRAQMRELLSHEPIALVPVTERNSVRFDATLSFLAASSRNDGFGNINNLPEESNTDWMHGVKALWLVGKDRADYSIPENALGFVNVYAPEHPGVINDWLLKRGMREFSPGSLLEMATFVKDGSKDVEMSAHKQALVKVFLDDQFKDVRAVSVWVTHNTTNTLDQGEADTIKNLGGFPVGSLRYNTGESVDSTCFIITRRQFLDALTGQKRV